MDIRRSMRLAMRGDVDAAAALLARRARSGALPALHVELAARLGDPVATKVARVPEEWHLYDVFSALREAAVVDPGTEARRFWFDAVRRFRADVISRPGIVELAFEGANWSAPGGSSCAVRHAIDAVASDDRTRSRAAYHALGERFTRVVLSMYSTFRPYDPQGSAALVIGCAVAQVAGFGLASSNPDDPDAKLEHPYDLAMFAEYAARAASGRGVDPHLPRGAHVIAATADVAGCYGEFNSIERDEDSVYEHYRVVPLGRCAGSMTLGFRLALRVSERLEEAKRQRSALAGILLSPPPLPG